MRLATAVTKQQLEKIEALYLDAFPKIERKPFAFMLQKREEGLMELLAIEGDEGEFKGLAIIVLCEDMALLDYFAIASSERGNGVGSAALELLKNYYAGKRFILEIERTDVEADNLAQRQKRKSFYLKNGMQQMMFLVNLFGVEMEVLTCDCEVTYEEYHRIYEGLGVNLAGKVKLVRR